MDLNELKVRPGSRTPRIRRGRGVGSGLGKTAGRGHKGQKARSGVRLKGYEGGQMPIYMRLPKRGFRPPVRRLSPVVVNLSQLQGAVEAGAVRAGDSLAESDIASLAGVGKTSRARLEGAGLRLLGDGSLNVPLVLTVGSVSSTARKAVESVGGRVVLRGALGPVDVGGDGGAG